MFVCRVGSESGIDSRRHDDDHNETRRSRDTVDHLNCVNDVDRCRRSFVHC